MKSTNFNLIRYDADEGKVFEWKEPHFTKDENGEQVQEHLYAKTLFIGSFDSIDNYIEVEKASFKYEETDPLIETDIELENN